MAILLTAAADRRDFILDRGISNSFGRRTSPPFRAEHIGSLLRPPALVVARESFQAGRLSPEQLHAVENSCIRDAVKLQEELGFQAVTDGEFRRISWRSEVVNRVRGFTSAPAVGDLDLARDDTGTAEHIGSAPYAEEKLVRQRPIVAEDCDFVRHLTRCLVKATLPSPSYMHFLRGPFCADTRVYPSLDEYFADLISIYTAEISDLAARGIDYVQLDEVALTALCDPRIRGLIEQRGEKPEKLVEIYIDLINRIAASKPAKTTLSVHMCRGNYCGKWLATGPYDYVAETAFTRLAVGALFLEFDSSRAGSFEPLKYVPSDKIVVLGLIATKSPERESLDDLERRVELADRYVPVERLCLSPACGFASHWRGNPLTAEDQNRKLALVVQAAQAIWGS